MKPVGRFDKNEEVPIRSPSFRTVALAVGVLSGVGAPVANAQAPDETWRTLSTEHFRITYPAGIRELATRAAERAERAHEGLTDAFDVAPTGTIDMVLTDHVDISSGFARTSPSNRITIFAAPPMEGFELAYFDDWLELVITHELAHIWHLDRRGAFGSLIKGIFGRLPIPMSWPVFPNGAVPTWIVEGLATYYESALTDAGRVGGSYHDMVLRTAILENRFEQIEQVAGDSQVWPAGDRWYVYGSRFFDHLVAKHGPERMADFARAVDDQIIPFRPNAAARASFGATFRDAFDEWRGGLAEEYAGLSDELSRSAPLTSPETLASEGRQVLSPRVSPDGRTVAYARSDGRSDTQVRLLAPDGTESRKLTRTNAVSQLDWTPDGRVVFSQRDFVDPYRQYLDLYVADPDGPVRRLTRGARVDYPSVSADGRTALAVRQRDGTSALVRIDLTDGTVRELVAPRTDVHWAYAAGSPDGRWIAASRWSKGGFYDVVLVDSAGRIVTEVTRDRAVDLSPTWSPDGSWLLWASDRTGIPNLFAVFVDANGKIGPVRQITNMLTGASEPVVDPSSSWIYFAGYHADGWHLERIPFDVDSWFAPAPTAQRFTRGGGAAAAAYDERIEAPERSYRAFPSVLPRYWEPTYQEGESALGTSVIGRSYGLQTTGVDLVGRHRLGFAVRYEPKGRRFEGGATYSFFGLANPSLNLSVRQDHDVVGFRTLDPDTVTEPDTLTLFAVERERMVRASATVVRRRLRSFLGFTVGAGYVWKSRELLDDGPEPSDLQLRRTMGRAPELSATVSFATTRVHPFSISREDGVSGFLQARRRWDASVTDSLAGEPGFDLGFHDLSGEVRAYKGLRLPGFANHVLAARVSAGAGSAFSIGGSSGQSERITGRELFGGSSLLFPVRGYRRRSRHGRYAWTASAEYRVPLARINRGLGDFPVYFDWIAASVFVDAGNAWFDNPRGDALASVGGELLLNGLPVWTLPTVLRTGLAVPLVSVPGVRSVSVYVRLGVAF